MPMSGLLITLAEDPVARQNGLAELESNKSFEVGMAHGERLAAVLDTPTAKANKAAWQWLNTLSGISHVDVVFVSLDEELDDQVQTSNNDAVGKDVLACL